MRLRISTLGDEELARLARDGHRRATQRLTERLHPRVTRIAAAIAGNAEIGAHVARHAMAQVLEDGTEPVGAAVVAAAQRLAVARRDEDAPLAGLSREERAALVATEIEGLAPAQAARQLGVSESEVVEWRERAHQALGAPPPPACAGWQLVVRYASLSRSEQAAADRHLEICKPCTAAWGARERNRRHIRRGVPQLASAGGGIGIGALLAGLGGSGVAATAAGTLVAGLLAVPNVGTPASPQGAGARDPAAVEQTTSSPVPADTSAVLADVLAPAPDRADRTAVDEDPSSETPPAQAEEEIADAVDDTADDVTDAIDSAVDDVTDAVTDVVDDTAEVIDDTVDDVTDVVGDTVDDTTDTIDDTTDDVTDDVTDVVDDAVDGATDTVDDTTDTATKLVDDVPIPG